MSAAYEKLKFYQDICDIRRLVQKITARFPASQFRLTSQIRDAARSAKQNIREGYKKGTANEFMRSIMISRGSLEELGGDIEDCWEDGLITEDECEHLKRLIRSVDFLSVRYLRALTVMKKAGTWKAPSFYRGGEKTL
ncbi:MAG: four helix bundle protein [Candidatus Omnitrophota bacterium]